MRVCLAITLMMLSLVIAFTLPVASASDTPDDTYMHESGRLVQSTPPGTGNLQDESNDKSERGSLPKNAQGNALDKNVEGSRPKDAQGNPPKDMYGNPIVSYAKP